MRSNVWVPVAVSVALGLAACGGATSGDSLPEVAARTTVTAPNESAPAATPAPIATSQDTATTGSVASNLSSDGISTAAVVDQPAERVALRPPVISGVSGIIADGQQISITGNYFGPEGPDVILFDDFRRGTDGEVVTLNAPVGSWHSVQDHHAPYYGSDVDGNVTGHFIRDSSVGRIFALFDDTTEIYISYRVMIPPGKHFPNSGAPKTFPLGSQWKLTWLMDGERGYSGNDDLVVPTWGNGTYFYIAGNDNAFQLPVGRPGASATEWFSFEGWNRFSAYMKGGPVPDVDPGTTWAQGMSEEFGQSLFESTDTLFDGDDTPDGYKFEDDAISRWNRFNVPGWHRGGDDNAAAMYDDIYIATGAHARARIEIGNDAVYANATKLAIATPTAWADGSVTATIRQGGFESGEAVYVFVIDESGRVSNGYPLTFGP